MYADYKGGLSIPQVAEKYGRSAGNVWGAFNRRGWPTRKRGTKFFPERFWSKVTAEGDSSYEECWVWTAYRNDRGYGTFNEGGDRRGTSAAHRVAYELMMGEIPDGLQLDHLCRNPPCVNPWHLEPVTAQVNVERSTAGSAARERQYAKTHCPKGHEYTEENILVKKTNYGGTARGCRACNNARINQRRAELRLQNA